ncbi:MAG TPA: sensor domain-containing protein, partial [Solirubrobacteraceae bacterium]
MSALSGNRETEAGRFGARLRRAAARAVRDFTYLALGLATSVVALGVWIAGLSVTLSLAVFIVGLPVFLLTAAIFRWTAELDRQNARLVLGRPLRGPYRDHSGTVWHRIAATARDPQTWRDFAWLVVHSVLGLGFGCAAVSMVGAVLAQLSLPLWFWALPDDSKPDFGLWHVSTLPGALGSALLAIPLAVVVVLLLRAGAVIQARLAALLLEGDGAAVAAGAPEAGPATPAAPRPHRPRRDPRGPLALHASLAALAGFIGTLIWALTGAGYFWPVWVWLGLILSVAVHTAVARSILAAGDPGRRLRAQTELAAVIELVCLAVWGLGGAGYFWPVWPALG